MIPVGLLNLGSLWYKVCAFVLKLLRLNEWCSHIMGLACPFMPPAHQAPSSFTFLFLFFIQIYFRRWGPLATCPPSTSERWGLSLPLSHTPTQTHTYTHIFFLLINSINFTLQQPTIHIMFAPSFGEIWRSFSVGLSLILPD